MDAAVDKAARRLGITPTQVILLWVKAKGAVIVTSVKLYTYTQNGEFPSLMWIFISSSTSKQHLEQSSATEDLRKLNICIGIIGNLLARLTEDEVATIDAAGTKGPSDIAFRERTFIQVGSKGMVGLSLV